MLTPDDQLPDCHLQNPPTMITPITSTPNHILRLSNLDDQKFLRFSIKYLYVFQDALPSDRLKVALSRVLVDYYPLAGRLRNDPDDDRKLAVDCNEKGAVFAEASMDVTAEEFLECSDRPNKSWRKLLYRVDSNNFLGVPPLIVQVTNLRCGGMILCTAISHSLCDGIGTSQFLHAWAHATSHPTFEIPILPFHDRHVFQSRIPPHATSPTPAYTRSSLLPYSNGIQNHSHSILAVLQSQSLIPVAVTFSAPDLLRLKKRCSPSLKCTSFEALAAHTWRSWVRSLRSLFPPSHLKVKLLFSINVRGRLTSSPPDRGYYGNAFVLACAQAAARDLADSISLGDAARLVQRAKDAVDEEYVRSVVDLLEDEEAATDMAASLVITQWARLGLEDVDFGLGRPIHMGPVSSDIYCLFLPVAGDARAVRVLVSVPEFCADKFKSYLTEYSLAAAGEEKDNGNLNDDR